jgi:UDP-glucose 6-dehydrogenase
VHQASHELGGITLADTWVSALSGADVAVVGTSWPEFKSITAENVTRSMRRPMVVDAAGFLDHLASDGRVTYIRAGQPSTAADEAW